MGGEDSARFWIPVSAPVCHLGSIVHGSADQCLAIRPFSLDRTSGLAGASYSRWSKNAADDHYTDKDIAINRNRAVETAVESCGSIIQRIAEPGAFRSASQTRSMFCSSSYSTSSAKAYLLMPKARAANRPAVLSESLLLWIFADGVSPSSFRKSAGIPFGPGSSAGQPTTHA